MRFVRAEAGERASLAQSLFGPDVEGRAIEAHSDIGHCVFGTTGADPITATLPAAHAAALALQKAHPRTNEWLINIDWPGVPIGIQLRSTGNKQLPVNQTDWLSQMTFNGGSEAGVVASGKWCTAGARRAYPAICSDVEKAVKRRNVGHLLR